MSSHVMLDTVATKSAKEYVAEVYDINNATAKQLTNISGIGDYRAGKIVEYREKLGGFISVSQLLEVNTITRDSGSKYSVHPPQSSCSQVLLLWVVSCSS